jgi:hypothetical protein
MRLISEITEKAFSFYKYSRRSNTMSIKGLKDADVLSVYDPDVKAFRERPIEGVKKQLKSFGLTDAEIDKKVKALKGGA